MSHRDAEELAAEIAYMQDDPSFILDIILKVKKIQMI
jgi:hypothetical protein